MAKGKWQVFSNIFNGVKKYRVGRQLREGEPLHSGNIEYIKGFLDDEETAKKRADDMNNNIRTVYIPAREEHNGLDGVYLRLKWVCPVCGQPRGEVASVRSYDGSRILFCDGWDNPCGHVEKYSFVLKEATANGLNGITNREFLNTCTNDEFAETVLRKSAELEKKYMDSELDAFDTIDCIEADFVEWLNKGRR